MSLTDKIKSMLFEDSWNKYGSEYMSHPYEQEQQLTIQPELPIAPSAHADMQLTDTAPPVDDENYTPTNNKELGSALAALSLDVPDAAVPSLYREIRGMVSAAKEAPPEGIDDEVAEELEEGIKRYLRRLKEANWDDDDDERFSGQEDFSADPDLDDEGNYIGAPPDEIPLKYLAQYYRDKPGKDPEKLRGSGESTVVTGTGRLLQNVVRPLMDVPKDDLSDAVEYLRLQFQMLASQELGMEKWPAEAPKTFQGMYFKKLVPKLDEDQLGQNFLSSVVQDFKRRNKRWLVDMTKKALAEVESERAAYAKLKQTLEKEAPHLAKVF